MAAKTLSDKDAKKILLDWPRRSKKLWPPPGGKGFWLRARPVDGKKPGPCIAAPGATLFTTQPDGLWTHFLGANCCDLVVIEVCGTVQNLNDKRVRYIPASHSLVLQCSKDWLNESVTIKKSKNLVPRWQALASFGTSAPTVDYEVPVRHLRVLYTLPNDVYEKWVPHHPPTGFEFFCPHSSLDSYTSQKMQAFLRQMSMASHFYSRP